MLGIKQSVRLTLGTLRISRYVVLASSHDQTPEHVGTAFAAVRIFARMSVLSVHPNTDAITIDGSFILLSP